MPPRLVFFPGAAGAGDFWAPVARRLPADWDARWLNWPGAGAQPQVPEIRGYGDLVGAAAAAVPDGSDVVAQSMGGVVAVGLALAAPRKIRRLVLVATSGGLDVERLGAADWREEYAAEFPDAAPWVAGERIDHAPDLGRIDIPTCLIWGDADPLSPMAIGHALRRALPRSELRVVRGGTHALARERPAETAALIIGHLS